MGAGGSTYGKAFETYSGLGRNLFMILPKPSSLRATDALSEPWGNKMHIKKLAGLCLVASISALAACGGDSPSTTPSAPIALPKTIVGVTQTVIAPFQSPWAMTFLPDGRLLVTDNQAKSLSLVTQAGLTKTVAGLPDMGGIYDVALSPSYASNKTVYLTFAEPSPPGTPRDGPYAYPDYKDNPSILSGVLALATAQIDGRGRRRRSRIAR
jgi:hypothetical protein